MGVTEVRIHLKQFGLDHLIEENETSTATVDEAAKTHGVKPGQIAKTLAYNVKDDIVLIVMAGDKKTSNSKFKGQFSTKARMVPLDKLIPEIGHPLGGVCPFGIKEGVQVYLDNSLKDFDLVHIAAGASNASLPITILQLVEASDFLAWVDISD